MPTLVSSTEIAKAVQLWNELRPHEVEKKQVDPFNGQIGRSAAAAMNFLLLTTASRAWKQSFFDAALAQMVDHRVGRVGFTVNKGHIGRITKGSTRRMAFRLLQALTHCLTAA